MNIVQETPPQVGESLSERLKRAYKRVSPNLRTKAAKDFADHHKIHPDTFRKKLNGIAVVTELECIWLEEYKGF